MASLFSNIIMRWIIVWINIIMLLITVWITWAVFDSVYHYGLFFSTLRFVTRLCFYLAEVLKSEQLRRFGESFATRAVTTVYGDNFLTRAYVAIWLIPN